MFINNNRTISRHQLNPYWKCQVVFFEMLLEIVPKRKVIEHNIQLMKKKKQLQSSHFNINSIQNMKVFNHTYKDKVFMKPYEHT